MLQQNGELQKFEHVPFIDYRHRATTVDFQLDLNKPIDIKQLFSTIGGFDCFDIRIDNMLNDADYLNISTSKKNTPVPKHLQLISP